MLSARRSLLRCYPIVPFVCIHQIRSFAKFLAFHFIFLPNKTFQCVKHDQIYVLFWFQSAENSDQNRMQCIDKTDTNTEPNHTENVLAFILTWNSQCVSASHTHKSEKEKQQNRNFLRFCFECSWLEWDNTNPLSAKTTRFCVSYTFVCFCDDI